MYSQLPPHCQVLLAASLMQGRYSMYLALEVHCQLLSNLLAAGEERAAGVALLQDLPHYLAIALNVVQVGLGHAHMVQHPDELLRHNAHPAKEDALYLAILGQLLNAGMPVRCISTR